MSYEYKFNFFLRVALQVFLEVSILSLLNLRYAKFDNAWQVLSVLVSSVFLLCFTAFFGWSLFFSCKNFERFKLKTKVDIPEFQSMFGEYKTENLPQALFNTYFMIRRALYAGIIVFLDAYPIMQAFAFMIICIPILAYHLVMNPYLDKVNNVLMNINESSFIVVGVFFYFFAEPESNEDRALVLGWCVIGIITAVILLNVVVLWVLKFIQIRFEIRDYLKARRKRMNKFQIKHIRNFSAVNLSTCK